MLSPDPLIEPMRQFDPTTTRPALSNYRSSLLQAFGLEIVGERRCQTVFN